jgi:hypothetical protein
VIWVGVQIPPKKFTEDPKFVVIGGEMDVKVTEVIA